MITVLMKESLNRDGKQFH